MRAMVSTSQNMPTRIVPLGFIIGMKNKGCKDETVVDGAKFWPFRRLCREGLKFGDYSPQKPNFSRG
jgi:hypothetical protein